MSGQPPPDEEDDWTARQIKRLELDDDEQAWGRVQGWISRHEFMAGGGGRSRPTRMLARVAAAVAIVLVLGAFGWFNFERLASRLASTAATPARTVSPSATATATATAPRVQTPSPTSAQATPGALNPPPQGRWQTLDSMSEARDHFTATLLPNGKVVIAGGMADTTVAGSATAGVEIFNPSSGRFTTAAAMGVGRAAHSATLLANGKVLVAGGYGQLGNRSSSSTEIYDPRTDSWSVASRMLHGRSGHAAVRLADGRVLVVGGAEFAPVGIGPHGLAAATLAPEIYDPATDTWSQAAMSKWDRPVAPTATLLNDGRVLVVGGQYMWNSADEDTDRSEVYDPASNRWTDVAIDPRFPARQYQTATLMPDGKVLVAGGDIDLEPIASAALFDPSTNSWIQIPHMTAVRCSHGAALLPSGNVLVIGSACWGHAESNTVEEFVPATNHWYRVAGLGRGRGDGAAVAFHNGTVLYVGGVQSNTGTAAAQLFHAT